MENLNKIASFTVNHDFIEVGIYISRVDDDIVTYDLRTRKPNSGDYMSNLTMHSLEHMFATYIRNGSIAKSVIYFGPMGCQTGFYLLVRNTPCQKVLDSVIETLEKIVMHEGDIFGARREECGNYQNLSVEAAKTEASRYLSALRKRVNDFRYNEG